jgi:hypothetical protein
MMRAMEGMEFSASDCGREAHRRETEPMVIVDFENSYRGQVSQQPKQHARTGVSCIGQLLRSQWLTRNEIRDAEFSGHSHGLRRHKARDQFSQLRPLFYVGRDSTSGEGLSLQKKCGR